MSITGVDGRLSSRREREPLLLRDFDLSPCGVSYPDPPDADDFRERRSRLGELPRDNRLLDIDPFRDLNRLGDEFRDLTGDEERDACREEGRDLES